MNRTPEQVEASRLEREADYEKMQAMELLKIEQRSAQIVALNEGNYPLDDFEKKFIDSLERKCTKQDMFGRPGGDLALLSDKQMQILNRLAESHLPAPEQASEAVLKRSPRP